MNMVVGKCPNCGYSLNFESGMEKGFCISCGSPVQVRDAVQKLKIEMSGKVSVDGIGTLAQLKANAQKSFDLQLYQQAKESWLKAIKIDSADHESYWGLTCCEMMINPDRPVDEKYGFGYHHYTKPALACAPPEIRKKYVEALKKHNDPLYINFEKAKVYLVNKKKAKGRFRLIMFLILLAGIGFLFILPELGVSFILVPGIYFAWLFLFSNEL